MTRLKLIMLSGLCAAILGIAGCFAEGDALTEFTVISTRSDSSTLKLGQRVQGESCTQLLFGLIPVGGDPQPMLRQAIERALESSRARFLVDGIASERRTGVPPILHRFCYVVEGTAANSPLP